MERDYQAEQNYSKDYTPDEDYIEEGDIQYWWGEAIKARTKNQDIEAQVVKMREVLETVIWEDGSTHIKNYTKELISSVNEALQTPAHARWEKMQKVVEAAKEYMEAHKAWHGEENRFNKMVGLKDALAALEAKEGVGE